MTFQRLLFMYKAYVSKNLHSFNSISKFWSSQTQFQSRPIHSMASIHIDKYPVHTLHWLLPTEIYSLSRIFNLLNLINKSRIFAFIVEIASALYPVQCPSSAQHSPLFHFYLFAILFFATFKFVVSILQHCFSSDIFRPILLVVFNTTLHGWFSRDETT